MVIEFGDPIDFEIPIADFPLSALPNKTLASSAEIKVFVLKSVHDQMIEHVNLDKNIECGGVLVGYPFQDVRMEQTFVVIVGVIPDASDNRSVVHFTVTTDAISRTRSVMEEKFPGLIAVGWYHSHPGHGVFLSGQDMTIVRGIYNEPWNLAWVIDPLRNHEGIFYGSEGASIIHNNSSHPLFQENRIWFSLNEYPQCIKDLQSERAVLVPKSLTSTSEPHQPHKVENTAFPLRSRREELISQQKRPWWWILFVVAFASALFLMGVSLFAPMFLTDALLVSDIAMLTGVYILMIGFKGGIFTNSEIRRVFIMVFSLLFFWVFGFLANYVGLLKIPIVPIQSEIIDAPESFDVPSATPIILSPTPSATAAVTSIPLTEVPSYP